MREKNDLIIRSGCWIEIFWPKKMTSDHIRIAEPEQSGKKIARLCSMCSFVYGYVTFYHFIFFLLNGIRIWNWWHHRSQSPRVRARVCKHWPKLSHFLQPISKPHEYITTKLICKLIDLAWILFPKKRRIKIR